VQKRSDSLVTVASSDSVGRLPDQNIAQAIGRLPGVAVERDQGQARYISLRGAPNYWTPLSFDGINVVSPPPRDGLAVTRTMNMAVLICGFMPY
jgi:outer membrane receptor for ferrienterochelin and colicin